MSTSMAKVSLHRTKDGSGELDVFEAARYFSGHNELTGSGFTGAPRQQFTWRTRRMSLDIGSATRRPEFPNQQPSHHSTRGVIEKQAALNKEKQPRSPGGRLASFLNSLFNQSSSKKKKSKKSNNSAASQSTKDHEDGQRRKRRSSISHFRSSNADHDSVNTPTKSYKDLRSYSVTKSFSTIGDRDRRDKDYCFVKQEKLEKMDTVRPSSHGGQEEEDCGAESDSSSDLFELKIYDVATGYDIGCRSDLPVYETTRLERIKIGPPISNNALALS